MNTITIPNFSVFSNLIKQVSILLSVNLENNTINCNAVSAQITNHPLYVEQMAERAIPFIFYEMLQKPINQVCNKKGLGLTCINFDNVSMESDALIADCNLTQQEFQHLFILTFAHLLDEYPVMYDNLWDNVLSCWFYSMTQNHSDVLCDIFMPLLDD